MRLGGALALVLAAGIGGAFIGRATVSHNAPRAQVTPPHAQPVRDSGDRCKAERAELGSTKAQLAICMAYAHSPRDAPTEASAETRSDALTEWYAADVARNRRALDVMARARITGSEYVIVRHMDGTDEYYLADEWPIDGDGIIVARSFPGGKLRHYAGPDAGPRTDPAAFVPLPNAPVIERAADGTLMVNGQPAAPELQQMFPGTKKR